VKNIWLYLSHLTIRRFTNILLCWMGYIFSYTIRYPIVLGRPISVTLESTNRCNLECPQCPTGKKVLKRPIGDMPINRYKAIIDEIYPFATSVLLHFQGEPLLNVNLPQMIGYASSKGMVTELSTNATLLTPILANEIVTCGIKKVVISIDSPLQHDFGFYRNGAEHSVIINAIKLLNQAKDQQKSMYPLIVLELLALKSNTSLIPEFRKLAKDLNVDLARVKTANLPYGKRSEYLPKDTKYSRYISANDDFELKGSPKSKCSTLWFTLTVTHDGWVVPCCFDKSAYYIMGHTNFSMLSQTWNSKLYNILRKRLIRSRPTQPLCNKCPQGRVRYYYVL
jgi:MoaA/NifB/PqqE/SkfB family radical SAM enzyme